MAGYWISRVCLFYRKKPGYSKLYGKKGVHIRKTNGKSNKTTNGIPNARENFFLSKAVRGHKMKKCMRKRRSRFAASFVIKVIL